MYGIHRILATYHHGITATDTVKACIEGSELSTNGCVDIEVTKQVYILNFVTVSHWD